MREKTKDKELDKNKTPSIRTVAMPADTNCNGDIFGGWLLSQMDIAGGTFTSRIANSRTTTVGITAMTFYSPVFVGDEVSCFCTLERIGSTSITITIQSYACSRKEEACRKVTEGQFTYVAINKDGKPIPVKR